MDCPEGHKEDEKMKTLTTEIRDALIALDFGRRPNPELEWIAGAIAYTAGDMQAALYAIEGVHITDLLPHQHSATWGVKVEREDCDSRLEIIVDEPERLVVVDGRSGGGDAVATARERWEI